MVAARAGGEAAGRIDLIDAARTAAIVMMVHYHLAWDLWFFQLAPIPLFTDPFWLTYRLFIPGVFLFLVGVGLVLAHPGGVAWPRALRRIAKIGGGALLVTAGTYALFPDSFAFFGVLHCIAVSSLLGLVAIRLPVYALAGIGALIWLSGAVLEHPLFDTPGLRWIGFTTTFPNTNDFEPIFPWAGPLFLGMAVAKVAPAAAWTRLAAIRVPGWVTWPGRHALLVYLVHQPLLIAVLLVGTWAAGNDAVVNGLGLGGGAPVDGALGLPDRSEFDTACRATCAENGSPEGLCASYCACMFDTLSEDPELAPALSNALDPALQDRVLDIARACAAPLIDPET